MATATIEVPLSSVPDPGDPFRYGWRYVQRERDDGTLEIEQVPLALEDVLHPREGDQATHSAAHQRRLHYLRGVFEAQLAGDPTAVVLDDVRVAWDVPGLKAHGPDIAVIFGVREREMNWSTFDVAVEGVRPALIVELTSPETAALDRSPKLEEYELAGVPLYVIIDGVARRREPTLRLFGFAQSPTGYRSLATDEHGRLWLEPVRLWLGVEEDELVCYDEADRPLGDYRALAAALAAETRARAEAERRAEVEQQGRRAAEARLGALEAELRRLRGEAP